MCFSGYFIYLDWSGITDNISTGAPAVTSFCSNCLVLPTICQYVLQRLLHFSALVSYYLQYTNMCCSGYIILQHWSLITYTMSACVAEVTSFFSNVLLLPTLCQHVLQRRFLFLQDWSLITYTMSTNAAGGNSIFITGLELPTVCQNMLQRLIHISVLLSYYLQYINICCSGYLIFQHFSLITYTMSHMLQLLVHFSPLVSYYLHYINICCSGKTISQHWSGITYPMSICATAITSFFSTALVLPKIYQNELQWLIQFTALVSYYLNYVSM
jgi:hypothetical protein